jgi:hypothetical protein
MTGGSMDLKQARERARWDRMSPEGQAAMEIVNADNRRRKIRANTRDRIEVITVGLERGDWRTLGYESPAAWYAELTDFMLAPADIRRRLAAALQGEGYSLRRIATELDVSKSTVERDLADAEVSRDETPGRVTGSDGKSYPARNTTIRIKPEPDPAGYDEAEPEPAPAAGMPVRLPHCPTCTCFGPDGGAS